MKGAFVGRRRDRLGARLLMLLNCIRLSLDYGHPYFLDWFPQGADAPELAHPEDLFDAEWIKQHMIHAAFPTGTGIEEVSLWEFQSDSSPKRLIAALKAGKHIIVDECFEVVVFPWEDAAETHELHRKLISVPAFSQAVSEGIAKIDDVSSRTHFIGYHFRRGDIIERNPWTHKTWPAKIEIDELYEVHAQKAQDDLKVVFSDSPEALASLSKRLPDTKRIDQIVDFGDLTSAQRDFLELYAMSRADVVIAPSISAFSSAAGQISGKSRSVFRDVLSEDEFSTAYERLAKRMAERLDSFASSSEAAHAYGKLHSYLTAKGRKEEAWTLGRSIASLDSDRAFLPILLSLNEFYLKRWDDCEEIAQKGLQNPNLWPEDHAVLTAILAAALMEKGNSIEATRMFSKAFWAKPIRPDVVVIGTRLASRGELQPETFPLIDWDTLKHIRRPWFPPFNNMSLVQHSFIVRRPINLDFVLLDWADLSLDQKARRLTMDRKRLEDLRSSLIDLEEKQIKPGAITSSISVVDALLGNAPQKCLRDSAAVWREHPENMLYAKRYATVLELTGNIDQAIDIYQEILQATPDDPFMLFYYGQLLTRAGHPGQGETKLLDAAKLPRATAAIQGTAGQILLKRGEAKKAIKHLESANFLCPKFKRFENQLARARSKLIRDTSAH